MGEIPRRALPALSLAALAGCRLSGRPQGSSGRRAELRCPLEETPGTFDPARNESADTSWLLQNIFDGLVRYDSGNRIIGALAQRWELSEDGRTFTFHLHNNAVFHPPCSRTVTAEDVVYSLTRLFWPKTRATILPAALEDIEGTEEALAGAATTVRGITAPSRFTVQIRLKRRAGHFLPELVGNYIVCPEAVEKTGGTVTRESAVGSGPFLLEDYQQGYRVVLRRHAAFHLGAPPLERIVLPIVRDRATAHAMCETGQLDIARVDPARAILDARNPVLAPRLVATSISNTAFLAMCPKLVPQLQRLTARQAIAAALRKDDIVRLATHGLSQRAERYLPPGVVGHNPAVTPPPYNPDTAGRLLAEAGFPNGKGFPRLELSTIEKNQGFLAAAQVIRNDLKSVLGIEVDIRQREAATFYADCGAGRVPFYISGWVASDPHDYLTLQFRSGARYNGTGFSDPRVDEALEEADSEIDPGRRARLYAHADTLIVQAVGIVPLYYGAQRWLVRETVRGLQFNNAGPMPHYQTSVEAKK